MVGPRYSPEAFDYYLASPPNSVVSPVNSVIAQGIGEAADEFGVQFEQLPWGELPTKTDRTPYVLAGPIDLIKEELFGVRNPLAANIETGQYFRALGKIPGIKLNLVTSFTAQGSRYAPLLLGSVMSGGAFAWGVDIPNLDKKIGGNTIHADSLHGGRLLTVSSEDVADNIRCETFRLAYNDVRDDSSEALADLELARTEATPVIQQLSDIIRTKHLWHRAPTDGALFIKTSAGWLASQTSSNKATIQPERFSLIRSFDPQTNTIVSAGQNPPSSDAPEFLVALETLPQDPQLAIHFHSNGITRLSTDPEIIHYRTEGTIRYGRFTSAPQLLDEFARIGDSWLTMKEHGVLWTGNSIAEFQAFLESDAVSNAHSLGLQQTKS